MYSFRRNTQVPPYSTKKKTTRQRRCCRANQNKAHKVSLTRLSGKAVGNYMENCTNIPVSIERDGRVREHPQHESNGGGFIAVDAQQAALLRGFIFGTNGPRHHHQISRAPRVSALQFHSLTTQKKHSFHYVCHYHTRSVVRRRLFCSSCTYASHIGSTSCGLAPGATSAVDLVHNLHTPHRQDTNFFAQSIMHIFLFKIIFF
jgi:hypothetical protein